jgi:hypothetical protein
MDWASSIAYAGINLVRFGVDLKNYHYMKGAIYFFIVLSLFEIKAVAQVFNTSLGFGYDAMVEGEGFPVMSVGVEGAGNGRWSVSGGFNFGSTSNSNIGPVLVDRTHYAFEGNANFYFRRTLPGFFLSGGGFFGVNKTDPIDGGAIDASRRRNESGGLQFGLGFSQQFTPELNMAIHSMLGNDFYSGEDSRLFFGSRLGYNWLGEE